MILQYQLTIKIFDLLSTPKNIHVSNSQTPRSQAQFIPFHQDAIKTRHLIKTLLIMMTQLITQLNNQGRGPHSEMASTLHWLFGTRSISTADSATERQLITNGDENAIATSSLVSNEASSEVLSETLSEALPAQDTTLLMEYATNSSMPTNLTLATNDAIATNGALATGSNNQLFGTFTNLDNLTNSTDTEDAYYGYDYYFDKAMADANDRRIYARFYMLSVILPIGLFFNTFAFLVFLWSPNIRRTTTGRFLIALTIADNTFIFGKLFW